MNYQIYIYIFVISICVTNTLSIKQRPSLIKSRGTSYHFSNTTTCKENFCGDHKPLYLKVVVFYFLDKLTCCQRSRWFVVSSRCLTCSVFKYYWLINIFWVLEKMDEELTFCLARTLTIAKKRLLVENSVQVFEMNRMFQGTSNNYWVKTL